LSPKTSIEEEIAQLRDLDLKGLRVRWLNVFGKPAPEHLTHYLLFRIIAYRLQADRLGDLDAETLKVLNQAVGQDGSVSAVSKNLPAWTRDVLLRLRERFWSVNGTESPIA
jgi:hypothetical protein